VTDLATLTATEMSAGYRAGHFTPVDVVEAALARIAALDPKINAVVHIDPVSARRQAEQAHRAMRAGADSPLVGIPVGVKDIIDVAGAPTTCHSRLLLNNIAAADAEPVRRLRTAGAIVLCKLATHEFALGGPSFDLPFPPARNPWNTDYNPGGSSSGSGAAVAAGFLPIALGSDTAGSIRHPAGACGVLGLKPTYDAISREGTFPLAPSLDHVGPMARDVADLRAAFLAMAGRGGTTAPGSNRRQEGADTLRVGYVRHFHAEDIVASDDVATGLNRVADFFSTSGLRVEEVRLPPLQAFLAASRVILFHEAFAVHAEWLKTRPESYGELGRLRLEFDQRFSMPQFCLCGVFRSETSKNFALRNNWSQIVRYALAQPINASSRMLPGTRHRKCHVYHPCVSLGRSQVDVFPECLAISTR